MAPTNRSHWTSGCEARTNLSNTRWKPRPEQIRILEAIFSSRTVNPLCDDIRRIRDALSEFGEVSDKNVYYWFQNRKARSRNRGNTKSLSHSNTPATTTTLTSALTLMAPQPSSFSSHRFSQNSSTHNIAQFSSNITHDGCSLNSTTPCVNQPFFFPVFGGGDYSGTFTQGFSFPEISTNVVNQPSQVSSDEHTARNNCDLLLGDLMMNVGPMPMNNLEIEDEGNMLHQQERISYITTPATMSMPMNYLEVEDEGNYMLQQQELINYPSTPATMSTYDLTSLPPLPPTINDLQGMSTVIINEMVYKVPEPLNVKEVFGEDAVLIHSSGQPVVTNEWGVALHPLEHGARYYLLGAA